MGVRCIYSILFFLALSCVLFSFFLSFFLSFFFFFFLYIKFRVEPLALSRQERLVVEELQFFYRNTSRGDYDAGSFVETDNVTDAYLGWFSYTLRPDGVVESCQYAADEPAAVVNIKKEMVSLATHYYEPSLLDEHATGRELVIPDHDRTGNNKHEEE